MNEITCTSSMDENGVVTATWCDSLAHTGTADDTAIIASLLVTLGFFLTGIARTVRKRRPTDSSGVLE